MSSWLPQTFSDKIQAWFENRSREKNSRRLSLGGKGIVSFGRCRARREITRFWGYNDVWSADWMHFACSEKSLQNGGSFSNSIRKIEAWSIIPHFFVFVLFNFFSAGLLTYTPLGPTAFHTIYLMSGDTKRFLAHLCSGLFKFSGTIAENPKKERIPWLQPVWTPRLTGKENFRKKEKGCWREESRRNRNYYLPKVEDHESNEMARET